MQLFVNNWQANLLEPSAAGQLSLSVDPAWAEKLTGLGNGDHYLITAFSGDAVEIMRVTAQAAGVLTIERAQEGTQALDLDAGDMVSANVTAATLAALRSSGGAASWGAIVGSLAEQADLQQALASKSNVSDLAAVATSGSYADLSDKPAIPAVPGDVGAASAAQGELAESAVQPDEMSAALADKVDKQAGKQLSDENYTAAEKAKVAALEGSHFKGTFTNIEGLQTAHPTAVAGDYADVDAGASSPVLRYIWDVSDAAWVAQAGSADPVTAAQVKTLYESNPDTNAFSDSEKAKLAGVAQGATANANTDSLIEGATNLYHTAARVRGVVLTGLSLVANRAIQATDSVLIALGLLQSQATDLASSLANKVDAEAGKQLSTEDYTTSDKQLLADTAASLGDIQAALTAINGE